MIERIGRYTLRFKNMPSVKSFAAVCGKKEGEGPLSKYFDKIFQDTKMDEETWEKAESKLQTEAVKFALEKANLTPEKIDYIFAGDLLNQCISSVFGLRSLEIPYIGQYGACSTMAQSLALAAVFIAGKAAEHCISVTSSHFCSAERQYRFPLEYGGQRFLTAQWTVTGSGAVILSRESEGPYISEITFGKIIDLGIKDLNNMGAAMAPAAAETLKRFLKDTRTLPEDYNLILTGDLGKIGTELLKELLKKENITLKNHNDCGLMIYNLKEQDVHSGGSGCGCSASVLCSYILNKLKYKEFKNLIFMATGALMSPTSSQQGETIPSIAHLIHFKAFK